MQSKLWNLVQDLVQDPMASCRRVLVEVLHHEVAVLMLAQNFSLRSDRSGQVSLANLVQMLDETFHQPASKLVPCNFFKALLLKLLNDCEQALGWQEFHCLGQTEVAVGRLVEFHGVGRQLLEQLAPEVTVRHFKGLLYDSAAQLGHRQGNSSLHQPNQCLSPRLGRLQLRYDRLVAVLRFCLFKYLCDGLGLHGGLSKVGPCTRLKTNLGWCPCGSRRGRAAS
mmetsp:Transcript_26684/g.50138  ORF Transcript_26684/g.50138 Transcript_26684/m.50138 type:complete len:224 (-) Transcript_26684:385-1056(-)